MLPQWSWPPVEESVDHVLEHYCDQMKSRLAYTDTLARASSILYTAQKANILPSPGGIAGMT